MWSGSGTEASAGAFEGDDDSVSVADFVPVYGTGADPGVDPGPSPIEKNNLNPRSGTRPPRATWSRAHAPCRLPPNRPGYPDAGAAETKRQHLGSVH
jgi:hypothetical protein